MRNRLFTAMLIVFIIPTLAFAMPQKITSEELTVVVFPNKKELHKALDNSLKDNGVAVGAITGKNGLLELYFWENRTKQDNVPTVSVELNISGVAENVSLQALYYVDRANMFEFAIHQNHLNATSLVIQARMNDPKQGDYAWQGTFKLKKSANNALSQPTG